MHLNSILVAIDVDEPTTPILDFARMIADASGASLHVLYVIAHPVAPPAALDDRDHTSRGRLDALLDETDRRTRRATTGCEIGTPAHEIVRYATDHAVDLIIMGTHSHGPHYELPFGSVADVVLRLAPCAVLAIKSGETPTPVAARTTVAAARGES